MSEVYHKGDRVRLRAIFVNDSGADTDPTTITLRLEKPDGVQTSHVFGTDVDVVKLSTGRYKYEFVTTQEGTYTYRWEGTGDVHQADERTFEVEPSEW